MTRHTPAPWLENGYCEQFLGRATQNRLAQLIATEYGDGTTEQAEANAVLISAAPDLLKALKEAVVYLDGVNKSDRFYGHQQAIDAARAAIAKTEGKQMKTIYSAEVEFPTELFLTRRKYWFNTKEERLAFIHDAKGYGAKLTGFNLDHIMTADEAVDDIKGEIRRAKEFLAEGAG